MRKAGRNSFSSGSSSPEKTTEKLPPRNPRSRQLSRISATQKSSPSRQSSSSPEKKVNKGEDDFPSKIKSSSPSPVRSEAPVPTCPSQSSPPPATYSSSFHSSTGSSSNSTTPDRSPLKAKKSSPDPNNLTKPVVPLKTLADDSIESEVEEVLSFTEG